MKHWSSACQKQRPIFAIFKTTLWVESSRTRSWSTGSTMKPWNTVPCSSSTRTHWFTGFDELELILLSFMSTNSAGQNPHSRSSSFRLASRPNAIRLLTFASTSWIIVLTVDLSNIDLKVASSEPSLVVTITDKVLIFRPTLSFAARLSMPTVTDISSAVTLPSLTERAGSLQLNFGVSSWSSHPRDSTPRCSTSSGPSKRRQKSSRITSGLGSADADSFNRTVTGCTAGSATSRRLKRRKVRSTWRPQRET
jgi:hypothetical protein